MLKLIITDIDGTLVKDASPSLNPEYFDVIKQLQAKGIQFMAASGRNLVSMRKFLAPIADDIWMLSSNGSVLVHGEEIIIPKPIPIEWIEEIWTELSKVEGANSLLNAGPVTYAYSEEGEMVPLLRDNYKYDVRTTGSWFDYPRETTYNMITLFHPNDAENFYIKNLKPIWRERLTYLPSGVKWVDMVMPGNDKGSSFRYVLEKLGIDPSETIAFGDNLNDLSMLEVAGKSYTVANARKEVQEAVDQVLPPYTEDGVLQELKRILASLES